MCALIVRIFVPISVLAEALHHSHRFSEIVSNLPRPTIAARQPSVAASSAQILFKLDGAASSAQVQSRWEPQPADQQFMAGQSEDEGSAVLGVEDVDIVTHQKLNNLPKLIRIDRPKLRAIPLSAANVSANSTLPFSTALMAAESGNASIGASSISALEGEADVRPAPAIYAIVCALGASLGYLVMMIVRCKGLLDELAPKQPVSGFMRSHLESPTIACGEFRKKKGKGSVKFGSSNRVVFAA